MVLVRAADSFSFSSSKHQRQDNGHRALSTERRSLGTTSGHQQRAPPPDTSSGHHHRAPLPVHHAQKHSASCLSVLPSFITCAISAHLPKVRSFPRLSSTFRRWAQQHRLGRPFALSFRRPLSWQPSACPVTAVLPHRRAPHPCPKRPSRKCLYFPKRLTERCLTFKKSGRKCSKNFSKNLQKSLVLKEFVISLQPRLMGELYLVDWK